MQFYRTDLGWKLFQAPAVLIKHPISEINHCRRKATQSLLWMIWEWILPQSTYICVYFEVGSFQCTRRSASAEFNSLVWACFLPKSFIFLGFYPGWCGYDSGDLRIVALNAIVHCKVYHGGAGTALHSPSLALQVDRKPLKCVPRKGCWDKAGFCLLVTAKCLPESLHGASPVTVLAPPAAVPPGEGVDNSGSHSPTQPRQQCQLLWQPSIYPRHSGASESMPVNVTHSLLRGSDILNSGHFSRSIHPRSASW